MRNNRKVFAVLAGLMGFFLFALPASAATFDRQPLIGLTVNGQTPTDNGARAYMYYVDAAYDGSLTIDFSYDEDGDFVASTTAELSDGSVLGSRLGSRRSVSFASGLAWAKVKIDFLDDNQSVAATYLLTIVRKAATAPFTVSSGLFDNSLKFTLGLSAATATETHTVWDAGHSEASDHFVNGAVMAEFRGRLYCMWQTSAKDEDAKDTYVAYSVSSDGVTWSSPQPLFANDQSNGFCSSGGWVSTNDMLVAFVNTRNDDIANSGGYTRCLWTTDGSAWSNATDVLMADSLSLNGIIEQDPHVLPSGRIVCAAHFQPGQVVCPIYTDDPTGRTGWHKGVFSATLKGVQSRELEPSLYRRADGSLVMVFRDQNSSYKLLAAVSTDEGETWTNAVETAMPDCRAKVSAGNLPDGTAFIVNCPNGNAREAADKDAYNNHPRLPLAVTLSPDGGSQFTEAYLMRSGSELPDIKVAGKNKRKGFHYPKSLLSGGYLYSAYATNKELVELTRIPLTSLVSDAHVTVALSPGGYATLSSAYALDFSSVAGLKAYTAHYDTGRDILTYTEVQKVPANTGLLLVGSASGRYTVPAMAPAEAAPAVQSDFMSTAYAPYLAPDGAATYALSYYNNVWGLYRVKPGVSVPMGKAYFQMPSAQAKDFFAFGPDDATGITTVVGQPASDSRYYNMMGQRVSPRAKGIVISNGWKYINK